MKRPSPAEQSAQHTGRGTRRTSVDLNDPQILPPIKLPGGHDAFGRRGVSKDQTAAVPAPDRRSERAQRRQVRSSDSEREPAPILRVAVEGGRLLGRYKTLERQIISEVPIIVVGRCRDRAAAHLRPARQSSRPQRTARRSLAASEHADGREVGAPRFRDFLAFSFAAAFERPCVHEQLAHELYQLLLPARGLD